MLDRWQFLPPPAKKINGLPQRACKNFSTNTMAVFRNLPFAPRWPKPGNSKFSISNSESKSLVRGGETPFCFVIVRSDSIAIVTVIWLPKNYGAKSWTSQKSGAKMLEINPSVSLTSKNGASTVLSRPSIPEFESCLVMVAYGAPENIKQREIALLLAGLPCIRFVEKPIPIS